MNTQVSFSQIEQYQRDGFFCIENFLNDEELAHWRAVTDAAVAERLAASAPAGDDYYSQVFTQCINLKDTNAAMRELIQDPRLGEMAGTLAGVDGVRLWHDQALVKEAYGNPTAWHLDDPFWSFDSPDSISLWVALDAATIENGCLWYLPGTHKSARYDLTDIGVNMRDLFKHYPEWADIKAVPAPLPPGGAVLHNGLIAHGAGANMTPGRRRAMTCGYMPVGSTFNGKQNVLPQSYFASLTIGDELRSDEHNPVIWSRY